MAPMMLDPGQVSMLPLDPVGMSLYGSTSNPDPNAVSSYLTSESVAPKSADTLKREQQIAAEIKQLASKGRDFVERAAQAGIPRPLAFAIAFNESRFDPQAFRNKVMLDQSGNAIPDVSYGTVQMTDKALQDLRKKGYKVKYTTVEDLHGHPKEAEQYGIWFMQENLKRAKQLGIRPDDYANIASLHFAPYGDEAGSARTSYRERIAPVLMNLPDYAKERT